MTMSVHQDPDNFEVGPYYKLVDTIGEGAYGVVKSVSLSQTQQQSKTSVSPSRDLLTRLNHLPCDTFQSRRTRPDWNSGGNQTYHSVRPCHVLHADFTGNQALETFQVSPAHSLPRRVVRRLISYVMVLWVWVREQA